MINVFFSSFFFSLSLFSRLRPTPPLPDRLSLEPPPSEDLDDLRMEGVTGLAPSGSKFSQGRSSYHPEPQAKVTLNICSRCAR